MDSRSYAVLTGIGADRVGIVDDLSAAIEQLHGGISDSRMVVLGGEFAIVALLTASPDEISEILERTDEIAAKTSLKIEAKPTGPPAHIAEGRPYVVESVSLDAPGIVHAVSAVLHEFGINIENLETDLTAAPWTGAPMFHMLAHILVPKTAAIADLRDRLTRLEHDRDLDIQLKPVSPA